MSFYKRNGEELLVAPNFVHAPDYSLTAETKDEHTYPVDGWYWFDTLDAAMDGMRTVTDVQSVSMRQARLALHAAGLLTLVDAAIAAMPEPDKTAAQITWEFAQTVDRNFGMVPALAAAMGMTETQIDDLFIAAAKL